MVSSLRHGQQPFNLCPHISFTLAFSAPDPVRTCSPFRTRLRPERSTPKSPSSSPTFRAPAFSPARKIGFKSASHFTRYSVRYLCVTPRAIRSSGRFPDADLRRSKGWRSETRMVVIGRKDYSTKLAHFAPIQRIAADVISKSQMRGASPGDTAAWSCRCGP